jgi:hypothetical protein
MPLRGQSPEDMKGRLKLMLTSKAGEGKTRAAIQFPRPYIMDGEKGCVHYSDLIKKSGGAVFVPDDIDDATKEVRALLTEKHEFLTLIIDPITTFYEMATDEGERLEGTKFGRHIAYANKKFKRFFNLISKLDMNVIVITHQKNEYNEKMEVIDQTFDGYKKLDYFFDLWVTLHRKSPKSQVRVARVRKTRLNEFPDQSEFEWSYPNFAQMYGQEALEKGSQPIELATEAQVKKLQTLLKKLSEEKSKELSIDKALARYPSLLDMPKNAIEKAIAVVTEATKNTFEESLKNAKAKKQPPQKSEPAKKDQPEPEKTDEAKSGKDKDFFRFNNLCKKYELEAAEKLRFANKAKDEREVVNYTVAAHLVKLEYDKEYAQRCELNELYEGAKEFGRGDEFKERVMKVTGKEFGKEPIEMLDELILAISKSDIFQEKKAA